MRTLLLAGAFVLPVWLGPVAIGAGDAAAQGSPSADQIIRALRPSGSLQTGTRGIRPASPGTSSGSAAPAAVAPVSAAPVSAAPVSAPIAPRPAAVAPAGPQTATATPALPPASAATAPQGAAPSIDLTVQFPSGSAELTAQAMRTLDELGRALNSETLAGYRFRIEGHTDTTGSREMNMALSQARAARVAAYLHSKFGVASSRLQAVGRGQEDLKVPTPDQTDEPRNRRVQVVNIGA
ncbi:MAG: OmpA family protein [Acetobacteraceae bacterium]|nr:OmpA family protein [Acetobacteraceae bacterium]